MKHFKKLRKLNKKISYNELRKLYNTVVLEYETLLEQTKNDIFIKVFEQAFKNIDKLEVYEQDIKRLKEKNKKLKQELNNK